jgi:hypothetical protein
LKPLLIWSGKVCLLILRQQMKRIQVIGTRRDSIHTFQHRNESYFPASLDYAKGQLRCCLNAHNEEDDLMDTSYWHKQADRFKHVIEALDHLPRYVHSSNSATALWHNQENKPSQTILGEASIIAAASLTSSGVKKPSRLIPVSALI